MTPHRANHINALVLIACSLWAFLQPDFSSWTVFIPGGFGVALLACAPGVKAENKVIAHVAVVLTLLILILLLYPFFKALGERNMSSTIRVAAMLTTCTVAMLAFIKSFKEARSDN